MFKHFLLFSILFLFINAAYVVEIESNDYKKVHLLGIDCIKYNSQSYICNKSDNKPQLIRFQKFLAKQNIKSKILKVLDRNLINVYSIQILSTKNLKNAEAVFEKYKNFPYARIEKINEYYVLRIGASNNKKNLKNILQQIKNKGFIRIADIKLKRIIKANFIVKNEKIEKMTFYMPKINKISKKISEENEPIEVLSAQCIDKKINNFLKKGEYKKACDFATVLSIVKKNKNNIELKDKICYLYHIKNFQKSDFDIEKINELQKALEYRNNINDSIELNYLKAKNFLSVDITFLNSIDPNKISKIYFNKYIKTLLFAGEINKINSICKNSTKEICIDIRYFLENKTPADNDVKEFYVFLNKIDKFINKNKLFVAHQEINKLKNINNKNVFAYFFTWELESKTNNWINVNSFYKEIKDTGLLKYNFFKHKVDLVLKNIKLREAEKFLKNNNLRCAQKEIKTLIKKYPDDFMVNVLAGDIYAKSKSYLANVYYRRAYLLNKEKYFNYLLKSKNFKRLINYESGDLKNYPNILAEVYIYKAKNLLKKNMYNEALDYALKAYKLFPSTKSSILIGEIYFKLKDYKNAVLYLKGLEKNNLTLTYYLAVCYFKLNKKAEAEKLFNLIMKSDNKSVKIKLIPIYTEIGNIKKVKEIMDSL